MKQIGIVACVNNLNNWIISHQAFPCVCIERAIGLVQCVDCMRTCDCPCIENYIHFFEARAWLVHQSSAFHKRMFKLHGKYIINYNHIHIHRTTYTHASTPPPPSPLPLPHAVISALGNWSIHFWSNTERYHKAKAQLSENVRLIFFFRLLVEGPFHHRYRQIGHTGVCAYNLMWF